MLKCALLANQQIDQNLSFFMVMMRYLTQSLKKRCKKLLYVSIQALLLLIKNIYMYYTYTFHRVAVIKKKPEQQKKNRYMDIKGH